MDTFRCSVLIALAVAACVGCARQETAVRKRGRPSAATVGEPQWGSESEGLQCRLRPIKRLCPAGESPGFQIDLCNRGGRVFAFIRGDQAPVYRFALDGRWRPWPSPAPTDGKVQALGPGVEVLDLPATLPAAARPLLTPGRHLVQVAFSFEGVEVVSSPVEIEIVGSR